MVRRWKAEDLSDPGLPAQASRALMITEKKDCTGGVVVFKAYQLKLSLNVRGASVADPGPAGFDWIEIGTKQID